MGSFAEDHPTLHIILNLLLTLASGIILVLVWIYHIFVIDITSVHATFYNFFWTLFCIGMFVMILGAIWESKIACRISYGVMLLSLLANASFKAWYWWSYERHPVVKQEVHYHFYQPYSKDNKLVQFTLPEAFKITDSDYPRLNGAYALFPVYAGMAQAMYPQHITDQDSFLSTTGSDVIYDELLHAHRDVIFALAPSKKQSEDAAQAGISYELTPFCFDAFVFYVNVDNPVDNLTTEHIRGIYGGKITDWKDVGAPHSASIIPYQRNEGSGSQTTLQKFMGNTPIIPPLKETRKEFMDGIINEVAETANYRNHNAALGFSFRYYATELLKQKKIKLLSIDGVAPTVENIRNGTYPLIVQAYVVTAKPRTANMQKICDFMQSPTGQSLVEQTGYVPIFQTKE